MVDEALAADILRPHLDAARDVFLEHHSQPELLRGIRMVVDQNVHDSERHYAMCRDDGRLIMLAPESVELPIESLVAILAHEMAHAVDFLYPGQWAPPSRPGGKAIWLGDRDDRPARIWRERLWHSRSDDQIELQADAIAHEVVGKPIRYCGRCLVQCFGRGIKRPHGLR